MIKPINLRTPGRKDINCIINLYRKMLGVRGHVLCYVETEYSKHAAKSDMP